MPYEIRKVIDLTINDSASKIATEVDNILYTKASNILDIKRQEMSKALYSTVMSKNKEES